MESLWIDTVQFPKFPKLTKDTKTDVLIVGGGLAGLLIAYELNKAGIKYLLIEADEICKGITANTTAKVTSQHGLIYDKLLHEFGSERAFLYWNANEQALECYRQLCQDIDCDWEMKDSYIYARSDLQKIEQETMALEKLNIDAEYVKTLPLPFEVAGAIKFKNQAQFHPLKFASAIASQLNICEHTRALSFEKGKVITNQGTICAQSVVIATHFPIINRHGSYFLKMYQERSYVLALEGAPSLDGMYLDEAQDGLSFRNYGDFLLLGGGAHRTGKQGGGWKELECAAKKYYPSAQEKYRWATQDCMTLDGVPYIGQYSGRTSRLFVAAGFNKWGMTTSMVAAMVLSDLIQGKKNPYADVFSPSRSILRPQMLVNAVEATTNLLALRKPRCPHLGCALRWNAQEHSWDCPCHGSRFAQDGTLLDNPATGDLPNP